MRCVPLVVMLTLAVVAPAQAWWDTGHAYLTQQTLQHLPEPLHTFIDRTFPTISYYTYTEPSGRHYIDIDFYSEFTSGQMPRDLNVLYAKYGVSTVNSLGISPWVIANYRATLTTQMSTARNLSDFLTVARTAGEMAHYLQDINQPLHTTLNYDGQLTGNFGIHARYEGTMISQHFGDLSITATPENCVYVADTVDWVLNSIESRTFGYVDDIMAADTLARTFGNTGSQPYYASLWNSTASFTQSQLQYATEMVASAWYSAWVDAGSPSLGLSGDYSNDGTVDASDYVLWRKYKDTSAALPNDFTPGIDGTDYTEWRTRFGQTFSTTGAATSTDVPEPAYLALFFTVLLIVLSRRRSTV